MNHTSNSPKHVIEPTNGCNGDQSHSSELLNGRPDVNVAQNSLMEPPVYFGAHREWCDHLVFQVDGTFKRGMKYTKGDREGRWKLHTEASGKLVLELTWASRLMERVCSTDGGKIFVSVDSNSNGLAKMTQVSSASLGLGERQTIGNLGDLNALSIRELKDILKRHGISSADCLEKSELVKRIQENQAQNSEPKSATAQNGIRTPASSSQNSGGYAQASVPQAAMQSQHGPSYSNAEAEAAASTKPEVEAAARAKVDAETARENAKAEAAARAKAAKAAEGARALLAQRSMSSSSSRIAQPPKENAAQKGAEDSDDSFEDAD